MERAAPSSCQVDDVSAKKLVSNDNAGRGRITSHGDKRVLGQFNPTALQFRARLGSSTIHLPEAPVRTRLSDATKFYRQWAYGNIRSIPRASSIIGRFLPLIGLVPLSGNQASRWLCRMVCVVRTKPTDNELRRFRPILLSHAKRAIRLRDRIERRGAGYQHAVYEDRILDALVDPCPYVGG